MDGTLHVLAVVPSLRENGGLRVTLELARRWVAAGTDAAVFAVQEAPEGVAVASVHPSIPLTYGAGRTRRFRYTWPVAALRLLARVRSTDVVVSGSEVGTGLLLGFAAARVLSRPFVVLVQAELDEAIRTWMPRPTWRLARWVNARADAVVCVSPGLVDGVLANGARPDDIHVVPNGVDVAAVQALGGSPGIGLPVPRPRDPDRLPLVVGVGRLTAHKGFDVLIRSSAAAHAAGHPHRLLVIGEGDSREGLTELARELGIADYVSLPGFSLNPFPAMAGADLFVLSSRTEAMPLTLLEALALGVPTVATRCCQGARQILDDGRYGRLVQPESVEALAEAITDHLTNPETLRSLTGPGVEQARRFDPDVVATRHHDILRLVVDRARSRSAAAREHAPPGHRGSASAGMTRRALPAYTFSNTSLERASPETAHLP